jgi:hypothetical protein
VTRKSKTSGLPVVEQKQPPSESEQAAIIEAAKRAVSRPKPLSTSLKAKKEDGTIKTHVGPAHNDHDGWSIRLLDALGTRSPDFANAEIERILAAMTPRDGVPTEAHLNAAVAVLNGARPRDEIEAMLASQMAVTHALAMDLLGRVKQSPSVPYMETCANLATKLQRTFVAQVEALSKLRRGGEQKVTVEHVHVHAGGQAIVGAVTKAAPGGGGDEPKNQ